MIHENVPTFDFEIDFLLKLYPQLKIAKCVIIMDGDPANLKSARSKILKAIFILCIYHANANVKKRFKPFCRKRKESFVDEIDEINDSSLPDTEILENVEDKNFAIMCTICQKFRCVPSTFDVKSIDPNNNYTCENIPGSSYDCNDPEEEIFVNEVPVVSDVQVPILETSQSSNTSSSNEGNVDEEFNHLITKGENGSWTDFDWYKLWSTLRNSPTVQVAKSRLHKLQKLGLGYSQFLERNIALWLKVFFTWEFTLGYEASALQENIHSSMKRALGKCKIFLHLVF